MKIGIISKKPHAKNHAQALKREGHDVVLLDGDPKRIPSSIDLVICRTASCSHGASNVALEWQRSGGGFLVMENGLSGALRAIRQYIEPKKSKKKKEEAKVAAPAPTPTPVEPESAPMKKITGSVLDEAVTMVGEGTSLTKVAKHFNVARSTLTRALIEAGGWPQTSQPLSPEPQPPAEADVLEAGPPPSESEVEELIETWAVLVVETRINDNFEQRLEVMKGLMEVEVEDWRLRSALMAAAGEDVPLLHEPEEDLETETVTHTEPEPEPEPVEVEDPSTPDYGDDEGAFVLPPIPVPEPHFLKACPVDRILNDLPIARRLAALVSNEDKEKFRKALLSHDRNPKNAGAWIPRDLKKADAPFASAKGKPLVFALLVWLLLDPEDEPSGRAFLHAYKELTKKGTDSRFPKAAAWALGRTLGEALRGRGGGKKPSSDSLSGTEKTHFLQALAKKKDMLAEKDATIQSLQQELEQVREEEDRLRHELELALRSRSQQPPAIGASPAAPVPAPSTGLTLDLTVDDLVRAGFQVHVTKPCG